jgi:hypothetical protein
VVGFDCLILSQIGLILTELCYFFIFCLFLCPKEIQVMVFALWCASCGVCHVVGFVMRWCKRCPMTDFLVPPALLAPPGLAPLGSSSLILAPPDSSMLLLPGRRQHQGRRCQQPDFAQSTVKGLNKKRPRRSSGGLAQRISPVHLLRDARTADSRSDQDSRRNRMK